MGKRGTSSVGSDGDRGGERAAAIGSGSEVRRSDERSGGDDEEADGAEGIDVHGGADSDVLSSLGRELGCL